MTEARRRSVVIAVALTQWIAGGAMVGVFCGSASAAFLCLLDMATDYRDGHTWLVFTLPAAGLALGWFYERFGTSITGGNNLVIDTIADNGPAIPVRMAPMILIGTVMTHLFGGSAGREGTAVQMGASLADTLSHRLRLTPHLRRHLLVAGVAGGFASVFGTPIAGVLFAIEFVFLGRLAYQSIVPASVAAVVGDMTTRAWGVAHATYTPAGHLPLSVLVIAKWVVFAVAVALATVTFIELLRFLKRQAETWIPRLSIRMAVGGLVVVSLWQAFGTDAYLGLGVPTIQRAFNDASLPACTFAAKGLFTAVTLSAGFMGGEVTPLFFIGATLGNTLAAPLGLPLHLAAAVGMAAVFASASNTPVALSVMAVELVGVSVLPHAVIVCGLAYLMTGRRSIYPSQRVIHGKTGSQFPLLQSIKALHDRQ